MRRKSYRDDKRNYFFPVFFFVHFRDAMQQVVARNEALEEKLQQRDNELRSSQALLLERANQIAALQREGDHKDMRISTADDQIHSAKELQGKLDLQLGVANEKMAALQSEVAMLREQLEASNGKLIERENGATQAQEKFESKMQSMRTKMDKVCVCVWREG